MEINLLSYTHLASFRTVVWGILSFSALTPGALIFVTVTDTLLAGGESVEWARFRCSVAVLGDGVTLH